MGEEGAGHFVKMVHNGIEYGDMQLICEVYHVLREVVGVSNDEISQVREDCVHFAKRPCPHRKGEFPPKKTNFHFCNKAEN